MLASTSLLPMVWTWCKKNQKRPRTISATFSTASHGAPGCSPASRCQPGTQPASPLRHRLRSGVHRQVGDWQVLSPWELAGHQLRKTGLAWSSAEHGNEPAVLDATAPRGRQCHSLHCLPSHYGSAAYGLLPYGGSHAQLAQVSAHARMLSVTASTSLWHSCSRPKSSEPQEAIMEAFRLAFWLTIQHMLVESNGQLCVAAFCLTITICSYNSNGQSIIDAGRSHRL